MSILKIKNEQGEWVELPVIKGTDGKDGTDGKSGVYVGTEPPTDEDMDVWIDSDGTAESFVNDVQINGQSVVKDNIAIIPSPLRRIADDPSLRGIIEGYISGNDINSATGLASHAEGRKTVASSDYAHAEGYNSQASGMVSHAEGMNTVSSGGGSHAQGLGTIANHASQFVFGSYNIADTNSDVSTHNGDFIEIVGNGKKDKERSNARTLDWNGNEKLAGALTLGMGTQNEVTITAQELKDLKDDYSSALTALGVI